MYDELKVLVADGVRWAFIQAFDKTRDGRHAWLALLAQVEGDATLNLRKMHAYAAIAAASYVGECQHFKFSDYINIHLKSHNELKDLKEGMPETKKVTDFLAGIKAPELEVAKGIVTARPDMQNNFEKTYTFMQNFIDTTKATMTTQRNVSFAEGGTSSPGNGKGRKNRTNGKGKGGGGRSKLKVEACHYTKEEWSSLSKADQEKVNALHAKKKKECQALAAKTTDEDGSCDGEPTTSTGSGGLRALQDVVETPQKQRLLHGRQIESHKLERDVVEGSTGERLHFLNQHHHSDVKFLELRALQDVVETPQKQRLLRRGHSKSHKKERDVVEGSTGE